MSAPAQAAHSATLAELAIAYHAAEREREIARHSADQLLSNAYCSLEGALSALHAEGTMLADIARLQPAARNLASAYERHRTRMLQLSETSHRAREALGYERSLARTLFALADEIGDDDEQAEAIATKVREVAEMVDSEDYS